MTATTLDRFTWGSLAEEPTRFVLHLKAPAAPITTALLQAHGFRPDRTPNEFVRERRRNAPPLTRLLSLFNARVWEVVA